MCWAQICNRLFLKAKKESGSTLCDNRQLYWSQYFQKPRIVFFLSTGTIILPSQIIFLFQTCTHLETIFHLSVHHPGCPSRRGKRTTQLRLCQRAKSHQSGKGIRLGMVSVWESDQDLSSGCQTPSRVDQALVLEVDQALELR